MFRSKTEVIWARLLNAAKLEWQYEPFTMQFYLNKKFQKALKGTELWYVPDFWLPGAQSFLEVKGVWDEIDKAKLAYFWRSEFHRGISVVASGFSWKRKKPFFGIVRPTLEDAVVRGMNEHPFIDWEMSGLATCKKCGKIYFTIVNSKYKCPHCRAFGDSNVSEIHFSNKTGKMKLSKYIEFSLPDMVSNANYR